MNASYTYDVHGQRSTATVSEGATTTAYTFTYEGLALLRYDMHATSGAAETTASVTYLYDGESRPYAGVYASGEATPVAFGIVTTDRGDVRELTDASGTPFAYYSYDAYGTPLALESSATASVDATLAATVAEANVLRYAGYFFDDHSGMYYLSQRYYDPATCQFITKDPAKADGEESAYQYCGGDPVGKVDPSGEYSASRAVAYADKWWSRRNPAFWTKYGGDCANFVSQCLFYGGLPLTTKWYATPVWSTRAWCNANSLFYYLSGRGAKWVGKYKWPENSCSYVQTVARLYHSEIKPGDVVFYDWDGNSYLDHTAIVAGSYAAHGTLVNQHTTNRQRAGWRLYFPFAKYPINKSRIIYRVLRPR